MAGRTGAGSLAASVILAAAIFYFIFTRLDITSVVATIQAMTWLELASITLVAIWNLVAHWGLWVAVTPGLSWPRAAIVAQSGTAVTNTIPGGSGIGVGLIYAMLDSWGFPPGAAPSRCSSPACGTTSSSSACRCSPSACSSSKVTPASRVIAGVLALVLLAAAIVLLVLVLRSDQVAARVGILAGKVASRARSLIRRPPVSGGIRRR